MREDARKTRPERFPVIWKPLQKFGPLIPADCPLSSWNGTKGIAPMRCTGGLLGGSWMAHMLGALGFERCWGGQVVLASEEIAWIVDTRFVGTRLAALALSEGTRVDLSAVKGAIVVFCSRGDDITPPAQALGWIADLYDDVAALRAHGQTIVYCVRETVGGLGIFVSGALRRRSTQSSPTTSTSSTRCRPGSTRR